MNMYKNVYNNVHSSLLIIAKSRTNPNIHQLMDKQKVVYTYYYSTIKRNGKLLHVTIWINLECIKKNRQKRPHVIQFQNKHIIQTEKISASQGLREEKMSMRFLCGVMKCSGIRRWW